jgi:hypothetical protein
VGHPPPRQPDEQNDAGGSEELGDGRERELADELAGAQPEYTMELRAIAAGFLDLTGECLDSRQHAEVLLGDGNRRSMLPRELVRNRPDGPSHELDERQEQRHGYPRASGQDRVQARHQDEGAEEGQNKR